jgi:hypothetical protein
MGDFVSDLSGFFIMLRFYSFGKLKVEVLEAVFDGFNIRGFVRDFAVFYDQVNWVILNY